MFKKLLISLLVGFVILFSMAPLSKARADTTWYNQSFQDWYGKVYDPTNPQEIFGERYTAAQVQWVIYGFWSFLVNTATGPQNSGIIQCFISNITNINSCMQQIDKLLPDPSTLPTPTASANSQSLLSAVFATDRPFSGISYIKQRLQRFSLVPTVHAATVSYGFDVLTPIQALWTASRNIAFGLFVIVAIVFAFMIMFRVKISPQTVIAVQSALPKLIVSLILVTFSYAIAGFLIDLMYVVIGVISLVGSQFIVAVLHVNSVPTWMPVGVFDFLTLGQPIPASILPFLNHQLGVIGILFLYIGLFLICLFLLTVLSLGGILTTLLSILTGLGMTALVGTGIGVVVIILLVLVVIIAFLLILWNMFKVLWMLVKAFANIILLTIFAPFQIALGTVIPNFGFNNWLKSFATNLAVFVITGGMVLMMFIFLFLGVYTGLGGSLGNIVGYLFIGSSTLQGISGQTSPYWPPLLGAGNSSAMLGLLFLAVSFLLFTILPKVNELIQALISGKPFAYGTAMGEAFGGVGLAYQKTIGPGVAGLQKYGSESMTASLATRLADLTKPGARYEKAPQWIKDFLAAAGNKPLTPYH